MAQQSFEEDLLRRWFPHNAEETSAPFTENDIREIADVLTRCGRERWSRVPRLYSILRKIGEQDTIDAFIDSDITDVYFPFNKSTLPEALRDHSARLRFLELQHLVYNREALSLERHAPHGHFSDSTEVPFKKIGELGKGGFGYVDRVVSTISHKEYARKLILRGKTFKKDKQVLKDFTTELWNLKRLSHKHLVELVGSYTDRKFVAIVMLPVADANLQTFLERADLNENSRSFLRPFFGCLTSALCYLHDNRIRHKDIKPSNVLIKGDQVYFTDFGTALDWSSSGSSVTATAAPTTPRYCAPEVMAYTERSSSSDIWSLGCVFLEMWTVLKSRTLEDLGAHMIAHGSCANSYHSNLEALTGWIEVLRSSAGPSSDLIPSTWIEKMLQEKPTERWNVHVLENHIEEACMDPNVQHMFQGICCLQSAEDTSEIEWTSAEDEEDTLPVHSQTYDAPDSTKIEEAHEGPDLVRSISDIIIEDAEATVSLSAIHQRAYLPTPYCETESESLAEEIDARLPEKPDQQAAGIPDDPSDQGSVESKWSTRAHRGPFLDDDRSDDVKNAKTRQKHGWKPRISLTDGTMASSDESDQDQTHSQDELDTHTFREEPIQSPENSQTDAEYSVYCPYSCGAVLKGADAVKNLAHHIRNWCTETGSNQHRSRYLCPVEGCYKRYYQSDMFRLHMQRRHGAPAVIQQIPRPPSNTTGEDATETAALMPRQIHYSELKAATDFEMHARRCSNCKDPLEVFRRKSELCHMGLHYARKVLELLYKSNGDVIATAIGSIGNEFAGQHPDRVDLTLRHYGQIESLFKAIEHCLQRYSFYVVKEDGDTRFFRTNPGKGSWIELHPCSQCKRPLGSQIKLLNNGLSSHVNCWKIVYQDTESDAEPRHPPSPSPSGPLPPTGQNVKTYYYTVPGMGVAKETTKATKTYYYPVPREAEVTPQAPSPTPYRHRTFPSKNRNSKLKGDEQVSNAEREQRSKPLSRDRDRRETPSRWHYIYRDSTEPDQNGARRSNRPNTAKRATTGSARKGFSKPEPDRRADSRDEEEGDDRRSDDISEGYSSWYGPEDVRWAPRIRLSSESGREDPPKPHKPRVVTYSY